jgi:Flp pilus assembly pilin Flp
MMARLASFLRDRSGAAAAEMVLVTPLLMVLIFAGFEGGNYFWNEHIVVKAVRDGARFAGRFGFTNYPCVSASTGNTPGGTIAGDTQKLVRTGQIASVGNPLIRGWTNDTTITVTYDCVDPASISPPYSGVYRTMSYVPVVKVSVSGLSYASLFGALGFDTSGLNLTASAQSAVMGI